MIIDIPYTYEIKGMAGRKRTVERFGVRDSMAVEILEIEAADAPVVVELPSPDGQNVDKQIVEYRFIDGEFYRQAVCHTYSGKGDNKLTIEALVDNLQAHREMYGFQVFDRGGGWSWEQSKTILDLDMRVVSESNHESRQSQVAQNARDLRLINGLVYRKSAEPVMKIDWHGRRGGGWYLSFHLAPDVYAGEGYVRLDQGEKYIDLFRIPGQPDGEMDELKKRLPVVFMPEALTYDAPLNELRFSVNRYMENWNAYLKDGSRELLVAYADIRDAIRDLKGGTVSLDDVIPTLEESMDVAEREDVFPETVKRIRAQIQTYRETRTDDMALSSFAP